MTPEIKRTLLLAALLCVAIVAVGCIIDGPEPTSARRPDALTATPGSPESNATPEPTATPVGDPQRDIVIIHTNDEHGVLTAYESSGYSGGGAALAAASWVSKGWDPTAPDSNVLLLSGGDNWTGPAISTWFQGESTTDVMNAMGYATSVLGNHEFDFGQAALQERLDQAEFLYLSANVFEAGTDRLPFGIQPYTIIEVNGVQVGVIGLALQGTPSVTAAAGIEGLEFGDYERALRRWVPKARADGADIIVVQSHICNDALYTLADEVADLGIILMQGGHCHEARVFKRGDTLLSAASAYWQDYVVTEITYDLDADSVVEAKQQLEDVYFKSSQLPAVPDDVAQAVTKWEKRADAALGEVIGYTASGLRQHSDALANLLVDSWLWSYPNADVSISNTGGFRQDIRRGEITLGDMVGVLPFDNDLLELQVSGRDIVNVLDRSGDYLVIGGFYYEDGEYWLNDGSPLRYDSTYSLLIIDYLYYNPKYPFSSYDSQPYETSIHWRQPAIDWIAAQHSTAQAPIEDLLDGAPRLY